MNWDELFQDSNNDWYSCYGVSITDMLQGEVVEKVEGLSNDSDEVLFHLSNGVIVKLYHKQDCCEHVSVEDVDDGASKLLDGQHIVSAYESVTRGEGEYGDTQTYTFYHLRTALGDVCIRWYGSSNGHYSESVDIAAKRP